MKSKIVRESNIELLRIISMFFVIILHYNNQLYGGGLLKVNQGSINYYFLHWLESLCIIAVNVFIIITGFFLNKSKKIDFWKIILLIFQVIVFNFLIYFVKSLANHNFNIKQLFICLIPNNYFVILYCTLIILAPFINILLNKMSLKDLNTFVLIFFAIFAVYPTLVDLFSDITNIKSSGLSSISANGSQSGYTIINFILMYIIGAYISIRKFNDGLPFYKLIILLFLCSFFVFLWSLKFERSALEYCNPILIIESILMFLIFCNVKIKNNHIINSLAKASFTVFLTNIIFMKYIKIDQFINSNIILLILHIFVSCSLIYIICYLIYLIYDRIVFLLFNKIQTKKPLTIVLEEES